jgi:hypothetical protein
MTLKLIKAFVRVVMVWARSVVPNAMPWAVSPVRAVQGVDKLFGVPGV